ncbi:hypothetical protein [Anatilimnocola floriformis]|uniref:hypothetical protein n=1 Tax=Anatilimnocola floriformis TaxID=2948575 RepID=UPI0020C47ED3|nr:hypothetical protein [Anatilimnocola floriformis]
MSCKTFTLPAASVGNATIAGAAGIEATKVVHQFPLHVQQVPGSAVVSATTLIHISRAVGTVVSIEAITTTPATGGDRTVSIDLQKSTGAGAFASILSAPFTLTNATVARTVALGMIPSPSLIDGDVLQVVVTVAGAAGSQAQGLLITVTLREEPQ